MSDEPLDLSWINRFAAAAGVEPLDHDQVDVLLDLAGHGAHDSGDRRNAPLACFLTGLRLGASGSAPTTDELRKALP